MGGGGAEEVACHKGVGYSMGSTYCILYCICAWDEYHDSMVELP